MIRTETGSYILRKWSTANIGVALASLPGSRTSLLKLQLTAVAGLSSVISSDRSIDRPTEGWAAANTCCRPGIPSLGVVLYDCVCVCLYVNIHSRRRQTFVKKSEFSNSQYSWSLYLAIHWCVLFDSWSYQPSPPSLCRNIRCLNIAMIYANFKTCISNTLELFHFFVWKLVLFLLDSLRETFNYFIYLWVVYSYWSIELISKNTQNF